MASARQQAARKRKDNLEREIDATRQRMDSLRNKLYDLHEELNDTSLVLSMLPVDVLTDIFTWLIYDVELMDMGPSFLPAALLLGSICRTWRKIVWSRPSLWRRIEINFIPDKEAIQRTLLEDWLHRSGTLPLDLTLHAPRGPSRWELSQKTVDALFQSCDRWKRFSATGQFSTLAKGSKSKKDRKYPLLTSVSLEDSREDIYWNFRTAKNLRSFKFEHLVPMKQRIPWDGLRKVKGVIDTEFATYQCLQVLRSSRNTIQKCDISLVNAFDDELEKPIDVPYLLPHLSEFNLSVDVESADITLSLLFDNLELPALEHMTFDLKETGTEFATHFLNLLQRSHTRLTHLTIYEPPSISFGRLLHNLPTLTYLKIRTAYGDLETLLSYVMGVLYPETASNPQHCLPRLEQFHFRGEVELDLWEITNVLKKRLECERSGKSEVKKLSLLDVVYTNDEWTKDQDPNELRDFYDALTVMRINDGVTVNLKWDEETDDPDW